MYGSSVYDTKIQLNHFSVLDIRDTTYLLFWQNYICQSFLYWSESFF